MSFDNREMNKPLAGLIVFVPDYQSFTDTFAIDIQDYICNAMMQIPSFKKKFLCLATISSFKGSIPVNPFYVYLVIVWYMIEHITGK